MVPQFVDVSSFQGSIDFGAYAKWARQWDGIARIAMKATEGIGFVDPRFSANRAGALNAGIDEIYYYHFGRPDLGNDPVAEAKFMHSVVGDVRERDVLILDYEVGSALATSTWAYMWLAQQEDSYDGKLPGIYASPAYIAQHLQDSRLAKYPLWQAQWTFDPNARPPTASPWTSYQFLQYTDNATNIPGIPGTVDCNIFLGQEKPMPPTTNQDTEARMCWASFFTEMGKTPPPTGTGIFQAWLSDWINKGRQYGPPITHEYASNDWSGKPIIVQEFAHARCEWSSGIANWYGVNGKII